MQTLFKKSLSRTNIREFRRSLRQICASNPLPDYSLELDEQSAMVTFRPRPKAAIASA